MSWYRYYVPAWEEMPTRAELDYEEGFARMEKELEWEASPDYDTLIAMEESWEDIATDEGGWGAWMGGEL